MYSTTIKSDGMMHRSAPPPVPKAATAPHPAPTKSFSLSSEQILILVIALVLLQGNQPDWLLIIALAYIFFG